MRCVTFVALSVLAVGIVAADDRQKRQTAYEAYGGNYNGAAAYRQPQPQHQPQHQPQAYQPQQQTQHYPAQPARPAPTRQHGSAPDEEEKDQGPHPLQLLLEKSKFDCGEKGDGYYADSDVGCQAFHYCVSGQKHSMMCPAGTVFHQVHLNCVPSDQDICSKANKFYFVNDYLNKPLEQRGPNNTVQYHQRYYPENYAVGDPFIPPQESQGGHREPPAATYGLGPAYREQQPAPAAYQPAAHRPQPPQHRPQPAAYAPQPQQSYAQQPQQTYAQQPRPTYQQQQQQAYRAVQAHQAQPVQYGYGVQQQQAHQTQALQAQRAYAQQQHQALAPQQHLYAQQQSAPRQRYA